MQQRVALLYEFVAVRGLPGCSSYLFLRLYPLVLTAVYSAEELFYSSDPQSSASSRNRCQTCLLEQAVSSYFVKTRLCVNGG